MWNNKVTSYMTLDVMPKQRQGSLEEVIQQLNKHYRGPRGPQSSPSK